MNNVIAYWAVWGPPIPFVAVSAIGLWLSVSRRKLELNGSLWAIIGFAAALLASLSELRVAFARIEVSLAYARGDPLLDSAGLESFAIWYFLAYMFSLVALAALLAAVFAGRRTRDVA